MKDDNFRDARGNLAFSQRLIDELNQQKVQGAAMQEEEGMEQQMGGDPMMQEQPVESAQPEKKEDMAGEARSMQDIAKTVSEATEMLKQGIEGLTAAVKEITPAKGKLREKLKGKLYGEE